MQIIITGELKELIGQIVIESFGIRIRGERGRGVCVCVGGGGGSDLGKGKGFQFQTSQAMNGKTGVPGGGGGGGDKNISRMQRKPCDINLDEGFTAIKAQEKVKRTTIYIYI